MEWIDCPDSGSTAGSAAGAFLGALLQAGPGGALLALVVFFQGAGFWRDLQSRKKTDELEEVRRRLEACEKWQADEDTARKIAEARAEGARQATAEHTGRHRRSSP